MPNDKITKRRSSKQPQPGATATSKKKLSQQQHHHHHHFPPHQADGASIGPDSKAKMSGHEMLRRISNDMSQEDELHRGNETGGHAILMRMSSSSRRDGNNPPPPPNRQIYRRHSDQSQIMIGQYYPEKKNESRRHSDQGDRLLRNYPGIGSNNPERRNRNTIGGSSSSVRPSSSSFANSFQCHDIDGHYGTDGNNSKRNGNGRSSISSSSKKMPRRFSNSLQVDSYTGTGSSSRGSDHQGSSGKRSSHKSTFRQNRGRHNIIMPKQTTATIQTLSVPVGTKLRHASSNLSLASSMMVDIETLPPDELLSNSFREYKEESRNRRRSRSVDKSRNRRRSQSWDSGCHKELLEERMDEMCTREADDDDDDDALSSEYADDSDDASDGESSVSLASLQQSLQKREEPRVISQNGGLLDDKSCQNFDPDISDRSKEEPRKSKIRRVDPVVSDRSKQEPPRKSTTNIDLELSERSKDDKAKREGKSEDAASKRCAKSHHRGDAKDNVDGAVVEKKIADLKQKQGSSKQDKLNTSEKSATDSVELSTSSSRRPKKTADTTEHSIASSRHSKKSTTSEDTSSKRRAKLHHDNAKDVERAAVKKRIVASKQKQGSNNKDKLNTSEKSVADTVELSTSSSKRSKKRVDTTEHSVASSRRSRKSTASSKRSRRSRYSKYSDCSEDEREDDRICGISPCMICNICLCYCISILFVCAVGFALHIYLVNYKEDSQASSGGNDERAYESSVVANPTPHPSSDSSQGTKSSSVSGAETESSPASASPSYSPSLAASSQPSSIPSTSSFPSRSLSSFPSSMPSSSTKPSALAVFPSSSPSDTASPSALPSVVPSSTLPSLDPSFSPSSPPSFSRQPTLLPSNPPSFSPTHSPECPGKLLKSVSLGDDNMLTMNYEVVFYPGDTGEGLGGLLCISLEYADEAGWIGLAFTKASKNPKFVKKEAVIGILGVAGVAAVAVDGSPSLGQQNVALEGGPGFVNPGRYDIPAKGLEDGYHGPSLKLLSKINKQTIMNATVLVAPYYSDDYDYFPTDDIIISDVRHTHLSFVRYLRDPTGIEINPYKETIFQYAVAPLDGIGEYNGNPEWKHTYLTLLDDSSDMLKYGLVRKRQRQHQDN